MTTRQRSVAKEGSAQDGVGHTSPAGSSTAPAVPGSVILKLLLFTAAMITAPLGAYFGSLNLLFKGNSTWAGATAALTANAVLIAYVIVAMREDQSERLEEEQKAKKSQ